MNLFPQILHQGRVGLIVHPRIKCLIFSNFKLVGWGWPLCSWQHDSQVTGAITGTATCSSFVLPDIVTLLPQIGNVQGIVRSTYDGLIHSSDMQQLLLVALCYASFRDTATQPFGHVVFLQVCSFLSTNSFAWTTVIQVWHLSTMKVFSFYLSTSEYKTYI